MAAKKVVPEVGVGEQGTHMLEVVVMTMMTVGGSQDGEGRTRKTAQELVAVAGFTKAGVRTTLTIIFLNGKLNWSLSSSHKDLSYSGLSLTT